MSPAQRGIRTLTEAKALSALANPYRSRLLDALKVDGPSTVSALATRTSQAVGSVSHHLKVLAEAGFVEVVPELAKDKRESWWRLVSKGFRWSTAEFADDPDAVRAALAAELLQVRRQYDAAVDWLENSEGTEDWIDAAFATQQWLSLSPNQLRALGDDLLELLERYAALEPDDGPRESIRVFARAFPAQP